MIPDPVASLRGTAPDRLDELVPPGQPGDGRRLPAGDGQAVDGLELLGGSDQNRRGPAGDEHPGVLPEVALEGEDTCLHAEGHDNCGPGGHRATSRWRVIVLRLLRPNRSGFYDSGRNVQAASRPELRLEVLGEK